MVVGLPLLRRRETAPARAGHTLISVALLGVLTIGSGAWALKPPPAQRFTTVVFRPGMTYAQVWSALSATDARLVWTDTRMGVVVVDAPASRHWEFYRRGALLVSGSGLPAGCIGWSRV